MRKPPAVVILLVLLFLEAGLHTAAGQERDRLSNLDRRVAAYMRNWNVPGLALAIVHRDSVILAAGYGIREVEDPAPVDEHTLFAIGSTTKAFTATAIGILVGEGSLYWDDPVQKHLPAFELADPWVTREITVRDLLSHRSGLPMGNLLWYGARYGREEMLQRLRYLEPVASFRSRFGYQNLLYVAAGEVIKAVSGTSWDDFVERRIFAPLGMETSNSSVRMLDELTNVATPHAWIDGRIRPVAWRNIDNVGPAGSINSSAADMARWLLLNVERGVIKGDSILPGEIMQEMWTPQTPIPLAGPLREFYPEANTLSYGLGWLVSDYRGRKMIEHAGGIDGMVSVVAMLPEEELAVSILTNLQLSVPPYGLAYGIFDDLLGLPGRDWDADMRALRNNLGDPSETYERTRAARRIRGTRPRLPLATYAATYSNDYIGKAEVTFQDGKLLFRYGALVGPLTHWHLETFRIDWRDPVWKASRGRGWVTFRQNADGEVKDLLLEAIPGEEWEMDRSSSVR